MTRYEKFKPGIALLYGEESVKTIDDAAHLCSEILDCLHCPTECYNKCLMERELPTENCCEFIKEYLSGEI